MRREIQTKNLFTALVIFICLALAGQVNAQSAYGELRGQVTLDALELDSNWKFDVTFARLTLYQLDSTKVKSTSPQYGGEYFIRNIAPGEYYLVAKLSKYQAVTVDNITISPDVLYRQDVNLFSGNSSMGAKVGGDLLGPKTIVDPQKKPKGAKEIETSSNGTDIVGGLINTEAGLTRDASGRLSIIGGRPGGTISSVDGGYIRTRFALNPFTVGQAGVTIGGVPAQFGDFTGGVISYSTKNVGMKKRTLVDFNTTSPFNAYHQNNLEFFTSGPIWIKNKGKEVDSTGKNGEQLKLTYFFDSRINYAKDPSPSAIGYQIINPEKLDELIANPLIASDNGQGLSPAGASIAANDIFTVNARPDADLLNYNAQSKITFLPNYQSRLTWFGSASFQNYKAAGRDLFNYRNNAKVSTRDFLTYISYQVDLPNPSPKTQESSYHISRASLNFRADFQQSNSTVQDNRHKDQVFDYGYVGSFTKYATDLYNYVGSNNPNQERRKFIDQNGNEVYLRDFHELVGTVDTAYRFTASTLNPERARFTQAAFDYVSNNGQANEQNIQSNLGLLNGFNPANVYGLWQSAGQVQSAYSKNQSTFISFTAYGEASLNAPLKRKKGSNPHDFQYGIFFEQSFQRGYRVEANDLWRLMPQLTNTHLTKYDLDNPMLTYNSDGVFTDTVKYNRLIDIENQTTFDKNLRNSLIAGGKTDVYGNPINESTIIDVNSLKPEDLSLGMFSADELLNNGNSYVNYYGYDYLGNKVNSKTNIDAYLNDKQNRAVGAFQPTYIAAWIQDQFDFKDLVFRAGLRMERYDANQPVLADPYSLYPVRSAGEVKTLNGNAVRHPEGINGTYKVYVDDVKNPTKIVGYRNKNQWYDAQGKQIANPDILANQTINGEIAPYLVNQEQTEVEASAFKDYESKVYFLPRFLFSFPVNSGLFFANYDVQTQRPGSNFSRGNISDYLFLENTNGGTIANPALAPRIKTSYEIGFKQLLIDPKTSGGMYADVGIVGGYANIKNDINLFFYNHAYPISYTSYSNIDHSSIKNVRIDFNFRKNRNLSLAANYTLLYANGTGSNPNSSRALIQSNQPNLRTNLPLGDLDVRNTIKLDLIYSFGGGTDPRTNKDMYVGPVQLKKVLEYTTFSANFNAISGLPYSAVLNPVRLGSNDRSQLKGNPFGSRLPYNYNLNLRVAKSIPLENKNGKRSLLNIYLLVSNVLNAKNQVAVYPYTGVANDDGYLSSPTGQQQIASALNAEAYEAVYRASLQNPGFFRAPRMMQLGLRLNI